MTTLTEELQQRINAAIEEVLSAEIAKFAPAPKPEAAADEEWPNRGDDAFCLYGNGVIEAFKSSAAFGGNVSYLLQGNLFRTEAEAKRERAERRLKHKLRELARKAGPLPSDGSYCSYIGWSVDHALWFSLGIEDVVLGAIPFPMDASCEAAIEQCRDLLKELEP